MRIAQVNANSLLGHIDSFKAYFKSHFLNIISICETWLHPLVKDELIELSDYFIIRNDRVGRLGGGVACYIHKSLKVKWLASSPAVYSNSPEFLILEVSSLTTESLLFASVYRRPKGLLFEDFVATYTSLSHAYKNIIIVGDINCGLQSDHFESGYFRDLVFSLSLHSVESGTTYHTATCDSWLDVIVTDSEHKIVSFSKTATPFIADHDLLQLEYAFDACRYRSRCITRRSFKKFNDAAFLDWFRTRLPELGFLSYSDGVCGDGVDTLLETLAASYRSALDIHAPLGTFCASRPAAPWFTRVLEARVRERSRLFKQASRAGSLLGYAIYREFRDSLTRDMRDARSGYWLSRLNDIRDPNLLWKELCNLGLVKPGLPSPLQFFRAEE